MPAAPTVFLKSFSWVRGVQQATTARFRLFSFTASWMRVEVVDRADPLALFGEDHVAQAAGELRHAGAIDRRRDVGSAVADEHAHTRVLPGGVGPCRGRFSGRGGTVRSEAIVGRRRVLVAHLAHLFVTAFMLAAVDCTTDSEISMGPVAPPHR